MTHGTRFPELAYENFGKHIWRFVDTSTGRCVGPSYGTKGELLADLDRYARQYGCDGAAPSPLDTLLAALDDMMHDLDTLYAHHREPGNAYLANLKAAMAKARGA